MTKSLKLGSLLAVGAALAALTGCGGNASHATRSGALRFVIKWPPQSKAVQKGKSSRVIPVAAQSIDVTVASAIGDLLIHQLFVRPTSVGATGQLNITNVPAGTVTVVAKAYPNSNGTGEMQASGGVPVKVLVGQTVTTSLTMNSTVTHVVLTSNGTNIQIGDSLGVSAAAYDGDLGGGNVVLTAPSDWAWAVDTGTYGAYATFTSSGQQATVTGVAKGPYVLTAIFAGVDAAKPAIDGSILLKIVPPPPPPGSTAKLLVLDNSNRRIAGFNDIGGQGYQLLGNGVTFYNPVDMAQDPAGNIYVADRLSTDSGGTHPGRILKLDQNGQFVNEMQLSNEPRVVYVDSTNHIYWRDSTLALNRVDDISGANLQSFSLADVARFICPISIATDKFGYIYVLDAPSDRVARFDDMTGKGVKFFGGKGSGRNQFDLDIGQTHSLAIDADSHVYVADSLNNRIVKFDANALNDPNTSNMQSLSIVPPFGGGGVNYFTPTAVSVDTATPNARIFFTGGERIQDRGSYHNPNINAYVLEADSINSPANTLAKIGGPVGSGPGQFQDPVAVLTR